MAGSRLLKGGGLRISQSLLYFVLFLAVAVILGIYSYFLSVSSNRGMPIASYIKAVEGISGAACLYLIFAMTLTCCLGGISFLAFLAIAMDLLFVGGMIAIAVMTRSALSSCQGNVSTPIGNGSDNTGSGFDNTAVYSVKYITACRLNKAVFAVSIIAAVLFACTALHQVALARKHRSDKHFGPGPENNYTSGFGKRKGRKERNAEKDAELGTYGAGEPVGNLRTGTTDTRPSVETGYTGSTVAGAGTVSTYDKVDGQNTGYLTHGTPGAYHTQPQGTVLNHSAYDSQPQGLGANASRYEGTQQQGLDANASHYDTTQQHGTGFNRSGYGNTPTQGSGLNPSRYGNVQNQDTGLNSSRYDPTQPQRAGLNPSRYETARQQGTGLNSSHCETAQPQGTGLNSSRYETAQRQGTGLNSSRYGTNQAQDGVSRYGYDNAPSQGTGYGSTNY